MTRLFAVCRDPRHHCALVLLANAGLVVCAAAEPFSPALALHLMLLPVNAWRLLQALAVGASACAKRHATAAAAVAAEAFAKRQRAASLQCPSFHDMTTIRLPPRADRSAA